MTSRVRVEPGELSLSTVIVRGDAGHHLARVTRVKPGERVVLYDGDGRERDAVVHRVTGECVECECEGQARRGVGADSAKVLLLQGVPKGDKLDSVVRQATELGVFALRPVYTSRSVPREKTEGARRRSERLGRIADEASRQCGRADVPAVLDAMTLDDALAHLSDEHSVRIVAWEESTRPLRTVLDDFSVSDPLGALAVLVGPEGGLSSDEIARAESKGFVTVSLGPRILRTETVAPALLAVLSALRGDLRAG